MIPTLVELDPLIQKKMMFSVCLASFIFIMSSSLFGMPISGTHTVIGTLIGVGIIAIDFQGVNWGKVGQTVGQWIASPLTSALIAFVWMTLVSWLAMDTLRRSYKFRLYMI